MSLCKCKLPLVLSLLDCSHFTDSYALPLLPCVTSSSSGLHTPHTQLIRQERHSAVEQHCTHTHTHTHCITHTVHHTHSLHIHSFLPLPPSASSSPSLVRVSPHCATPQLTLSSTLCLPLCTPALSLSIPPLLHHPTTRSGTSLCTHPPRSTSPSTQDAFLLTHPALNWTQIHPNLSLSLSLSLLSTFPITDKQNCISRFFSDSKELKKYICSKTVIIKSSKMRIERQCNQYQKMEFR